MITSKHKMAPRWRHGWVITLKSLYLSSPDNDKDTVKIWTWLLILFLRYHGPNIHTERNNNNNNNNENKIRTNSIGDMLQCSISPNKSTIQWKLDIKRSDITKYLTQRTNLSGPNKLTSSVLLFADHRYNKVSDTTNKTSRSQLRTLLYRASTV